MRAAEAHRNGLQRTTTHVDTGGTSTLQQTATDLERAAEAHRQTR